MGNNGDFKPNEVTGIKSPIHNTRILAHSQSSEKMPSLPGDHYKNDKWGGIQR